MIKLRIPKFDRDLNFVGYSQVAVRNKMNSVDYNKVVSLLPGMPQGYCKEIYDIYKTKKPIEITKFYDIRQRGLKKIRNQFITII